MIKNGKGGGNTKTGLVFEGKTDLATFLNSQDGYCVTDGVVFYNDEKVARIFKKHGFYRYLKEVGVDWTKIISKKLLPDDSIYVIINNTYINKVREYKLCDFGDEAVIDEQYFNDCVAILKTMIGRVDREIRNTYKV
ncbi:MAG: hypothetical protein NC223_09605 [Butyrivibrio sp.]|nr:hypothetical protein [Butyrivibrio sp.]